jgi:hypothetical protein
MWWDGFESPSGYAVTNEANIAVDAMEEKAVCSSFKLAL